MLDMVVTDQKSDATYQHQHAERSCPSSTDGGHDQQGTQDQPWMSD